MSGTSIDGAPTPAWCSAMARPRWCFPGDLGLRKSGAWFTRADTVLEEMHRGDEPLAFAAERRGHIDVRARKKSFLGSTKLEQSLQRLFHAQLTGTVNQALTEAGTGLDEVAVLVLPHLGTSSSKKGTWCR